MNVTCTDNNLEKEKIKIYQFYIEKHNEFKKKYGEKTLILIMVGSFYEMYGLFDEGPNMHEISKLLNIVCTRKNKALKESHANPKMMGFQMNSLEKFLEILTNNNYTVIVYDQKVNNINNKKVITREISGIYTKSINIGNITTSNNNYLMCLYIINEEQKKSKPLISVGLSCVDLSTGQVFVNSSYSEKFDEYIALDDAMRFINNMNPGEILIYYDDCSKAKNNNSDMENFLYGYFDIDDYSKCKYYSSIDDKYKNLTCQNEYLKIVYPDAETLLSPIEQLDLETEPLVVISLCLLFDFVNDKMPSLLKNIKHPEFNFDSSHLVLGNNAVAQLDIFDCKENINVKAKYKSLFNVVNETLTPLGERYLRNILTSPFVEKEKLNLIYDTTEKMRNLNIPEKINVFLSEIKDIERLVRKMELKIIKPYELCLLVNSYENVLETYKIFDKYSNKTNEFKQIIKNKNLNKIIPEFINCISNIFNMENLMLYPDIDFNDKIQIYKTNIHKDIDELNNKINSGKSVIEKLANKLSSFFVSNSQNSENNKVEIKNSKKEGNYIFIVSQFKNEFLNLFENYEISENITVTLANMKIVTNKLGLKLFIPAIEKSSDLFKLKNYIIELIGEKNIAEKKQNFFEIKNNSQDGYYLLTTTNRANMLKELLSKTEMIDLEFTKIKTQDLEFKTTKNTTKIIIPQMSGDCDNLEDYTEEISNLYKKYYTEDIFDIYDKFSKIFSKINEYVTQIDYFNSCTILSLKHGYTKPIITDSEKSDSYVNAIKIRHPIVERIIDHEYIPHDIHIGGSNMKGMLIYGLNSSGKSVLMKSVGLCVIMAQCGLYVPADKFTYYPYTKLLTRITGNDNIFKGLSSFGVEMSEINSILKRSDKNTLIIGDEICRGTEYVSGNALVAATIMKLQKLKPTFIFTTHLHEIMNLEEIKSLSNIKAFHLNVTYDAKKDTLIYDRKLLEGCGEPIYGITVAKYIIKDNSFMEDAINIKNKLLNNYDSLVSGKKSKYNSDIYIHECNICHAKDNVKLTNLETHHINFQKDCDDNSIVINKKHMNKNDKSNLVILCQECHDKIHSNKLNISGYVKTTNGKVLVHS